MATQIIADEAKHGHKSAGSMSIEAKDRIDEAVKIGLLSTWIENARCQLQHLTLAAQNDPKLSALLTKHDIRINAALWDLEESEALTYVQSTQLRTLRHAMSDPEGGSTPGASADLDYWEMADQLDNIQESMRVGLEMVADTITQYDIGNRDEMARAQERVLFMAEHAQSKLVHLDKISNTLREVQHG